MACLIKDGEAISRQNRKSLDGKGLTGAREFPGWRYETKCLHAFLFGFVLVF
jgi:hypothetical protein